MPEEPVIKVRLTLKGRPLKSYTFAKDIVSIGRDPEKPAPRVPGIDPLDELVLQELLRLGEARVGAGVDPGELAHRFHLGSGQSVALDKTVLGEPAATGQQHHG